MHPHPRPLLPLFLLVLSMHASAADREFTLEARMTGYVGATGPIAGERNPALRVTKGDNVKITLINSEPMAHDIVLDAHKVKSQQILKVGDKTEVTFVAEQSDAYYCSLPGHRQVGMEGQLVVGSAAGGEGAVDESVAAHQPMAMATKPIMPVRPVTDDEIGADPTKVPPPVARKEPATVSYRMTSKEVTAQIEDGATYEYWCYDGQVPGPMLRARVGDTVEVTLYNDATSKMVHSIDFHAATGPGGGAPMLQVPPGQDKMLRFKALNPGLYVYHCATPHIPTHLSRGMYGMILIEPEKGLPKVDREYYVMQGDFYTTHKPRTRCHQEQDDERLFEEQPTYVCMNGRVGSITGARTMTAKAGETVRIYYGVGGPNLTSSFHIIGEIFDQLYREGDLLSPPALSVQTTMVPAGGATVIDMKTEVPGTYLLVDHSLTRLDKGNVGLLKVEGEPRPDIISTGK
jgi:nitrite reductase (NO-forming)